MSIPSESMDISRIAAARISSLAVAADRVGATASFLCAVHCALLPFVIALLPLIGLGFLADHRFERIFVSCAAILASFTIVTAWRRHRRLHALFLLIPGIALLLSGIIIDIGRHEWLHTVLVVCGGVLVASAHVTNLILSHRHVHLGEPARSADALNGIGCAGERPKQEAEGRVA